MFECIGHDRNSEALKARHVIAWVEASPTSGGPGKRCFQRWTPEGAVPQSGAKHDSWFRFDNQPFDHAAEELIGYFDRIETALQRRIIPQHVERLNAQMQHPTARSPAGKTVPSKGNSGGSASESLFVFGGEFHDYSFTSFLQIIKDNSSDK